MAKMVIVEEEVQNSQYENFDWEKVGDKLNFLFMDTADRTSPTYGDFFVMLGLKVDDLSSIEDAVKSAKIISLIPRTVLINAFNNGSVVKEELYQIEFAYDQGQKFSDGKIAKSKGYNIKHLVLGEDDRQTLIKQYKKLLTNNATDSVVKTETTVTEPKL